MIDIKKCLMRPLSTSMIQKEARLYIYQYNFKKKYPHEKYLVHNPPFSKTFVHHPFTLQYTVGRSRFVFIFNIFSLNFE